jgi:hypothetical protein
MSLQHSTTQGTYRAQFRAQCPASNHDPSKSAPKCPNENNENSEMQMFDFQTPLWPEQHQSNADIKAQLSTTHHITSHHITSHHITSHHITAQPQHSTAQHSHSTAQHSTAQHSTQHMLRAWYQHWISSKSFHSAHTHPPTA